MGDALSVPPYSLLLLGSNLSLFYKYNTYTVLITCSIAPREAQTSNEKIYIVITRLPLSHYENLNSNTFYKQRQEFER